MRQITIRAISNIALTVLFAMALPNATAQKAANEAQRVASEPLQIRLVRSKIVLENGREVMRSATVANPGEILEEVATYTNTSRSALRSVEATLPVPLNTELVMASVKPANAMASTDGSNFSKIPLMRKIRESNGVEVEQAVPLSEYRYLRWYPGELAPDKPVSFSARFKLATTPAAVNNATK